jgi:PAS domain S-box-containing protein
MPKMDGLEVLQKIRHQDPDIPFIILSARGTVSMAVKAIKKGADHFVLKPAEINQLAITIEQTIEKTKLKKKLKDSQDAFRIASENVPDIIYSLGPKGDFISLSPSIKTSMGYKPSELIGTSVFKVIHPDDRQKVKESFMQSVKSGDTKIKILQFRMMTKSGEAKHFEIRRKMVLENGRMIRNDGIARDISHRVNLEEKLRDYHEEMAQANLDLLSAQKESEEKNTEMEKLLKEMSKNKDELQTIIDANPNIIFLVDNRGIIKASNRSVSDFFGLSLDKVVSLNFDEFIDKIKGNFEDFDKFSKELKQSKKTPVCDGRINTADLYKRGVRVINHKPGILSPISCRVQDKDNKEIGHLWMFIDISLMKQANEQVHAIVNASPIPIIISHLEDGKILYVNEELAGLIGLTAEELIGQSTPDFYYNPGDRKTVVESLKRDGYLRNFETQIKKVDGSVIWMIFSLVTSEMGGEKVILGWLYDITERKKSEEALATRLRYEEGLAHCSQALMKDVSAKDALKDALTHLLKASKTSRVYIFENFEDPEDGLCLRLTHEVCAPGVSGNLDNPVLQHGIYKQGFERWRKTLSQCKPILGLVETFPKGSPLMGGRKMVRLYWL